MSRVCHVLACIAIRWARSQSESALKGRFIIHDGEYKSRYENSLPKTLFFFFGGGRDELVWLVCPAPCKAHDKGFVLAR